MNANNQFLYWILVKSGGAFAGYAATELLQRSESAGERLGPDPFTAWQGLLAGRVDDLAAAAAVDRVSLFVSQTQWAKAVLEARGIPAAHFRIALESLRAVLAEHLPEEVRPLAAGYVDQALTALDESPMQIATPLAADGPDGRLAAAYILAILEGDRRRAADMVLGEARRGRSAADIYLHILRPVQEEIGRMWVANEINVAEEHFASATTKRLLAQLSQLATYKPRNGRSMLAAAVAGNLHDLGVQMVADFFEMDGWRVIQLGADAPIPDLVQAVEGFRIDLLALSVARATQQETLRETIKAVRQGPRGLQVKVLVGGIAFANLGDLPLQLGADAYADDALEAVAIGNRLVGLSAE
jgi:MerR family transcriptional regulator, light-induced transcriptional regulator